jgi:hypothetical protein
MPEKNMFYLSLNFIFYMKNFSKAMLSIIFTALIVGSVQPVLADEITDLFKPVPIRNSEYQFHLQVVVRDSHGQLVSVTESTNGYYVPHDVTDEAFDRNFGKKEIVTVDDIKYEKVQYIVKDRHYRVPMKLMFFIPAVIEVSYGAETVTVEAFIFQAFVPLVYLEDDDVVDTQWTIFRKIK